MSLQEQAELRQAILSYWPTVAMPVRKLENEISAWRPRLLLVDTYSVAVWMRHVGADRVALAWSWGVSAFGAVAQTDPLSIETNALLLDDEGCPIKRSEKALRLNGILYRLNWHKSLFDAQIVIRSAKEFVDALRLPS